MSNLMPFDFESHPVRVITDDKGEPLFVAKDVAVALEYKDTVNAIKQHCKGVVKYHPLQTSGGIQNVRVIHEPDLYRLLAGSTLPSAQRFESWLFEEVLPSIRKTGGYSVKGRVLPQDFSSDLLTIAKAIQVSADAAQALANTVRALVDKYASHASSELSPSSLTCPHIVNCEQRTQPQLLKPTASPLAITSQAPPCADSIFLTVLRESLESQPFTANKLYLIIVARQYPALTDAAVNLLGDVTTWSARKLGQILGRWSRSELSCYRVLNLGPSKNGVLWRLEQVS